MLNYEEEDKKWDNWDGGYGVKIHTVKRKTEGSFNCCKIGCFFCCVICLITLPITFTSGKFICDLHISNQNFVYNAGVNSNNSM